jgi:hypothetical protein
MELKNKIEIMLEWIPTCLSIITKYEIYEKEFDFIYGQQEETKDIKKIKHKLKRILKNG